MLRVLLSTVFVSDLQWKGGDYSEASQSVNVGLSLLAFPNQTATFAIGRSGSIIPGTFNF